MKTITIKNNYTNLYKNFGIGRITALRLLRKIGINTKSNFFKSRFKRMQVRILSKYKKKLTLNKRLIVKLKEIKKFNQKTNIYRGLRNRFKYPCRGQRTKTNGKTKKKLKY